MKLVKLNLNFTRPHAITYTNTRVIAYFQTANSSKMHTLHLVQIH